MSVPSTVVGVFAYQSIHPTVALSFREIWTRMQVGPFNPAVVAVAAVCFYCAILVMVVYGGKSRRTEPEDEVAGFERNLDQWKR